MRQTPFTSSLFKSKQRKRKLKFNESNYSDENILE